MNMQKFEGVWAVGLYDQGQCIKLRGCREVAISEDRRVLQFLDTRGVLHITTLPFVLQTESA